MLITGLWVKHDYHNFKYLKSCVTAVDKSYSVQFINLLNDFTVGYAMWIE